MRQPHQLLERTRADYKGKKVEVTGYYVVSLNITLLRDDQNGDYKSPLWISPFRQGVGYRQNFDGRSPINVTDVELFERTELRL